MSARHQYNTPVKRLDMNIPLERTKKLAYRTVDNVTIRAKNKKIKMNLDKEGNKIVYYSVSDLGYLSSIVTIIDRTGEDFYGVLQVDPNTVQYYKVYLSIPEILKIMQSLIKFTEKIEKQCASDYKFIKNCEDTGTMQSFIIDMEKREDSLEDIYQESLEA